MIISIDAEKKHFKNWIIILIKILIKIIEGTFLNLINTSTKKPKQNKIEAYRVGIQTGRKKQNSYLQMQ